VRGVDNRVVVRPPVATPAVRARVAEALQARAAQAAASVEVLTQGSTVVLRGIVGTAADRAAVEQGAWRVPGVTAVRNELSVPP
jgi:osmotically-inducible protein OsmY